MSRVGVSSSLDLGFKVHITGGSLEIIIPIPDQNQSVAWLKAELKARADERGKDVNVHELSLNGYFLDDSDNICDVLGHDSCLIAIGQGLDPLPTRFMSVNDGGLKHEGWS